MDSERTTIDVHRAAFTYDGNTALSDVEFTVRAGEMTALVGPNGGGKSTLLKGLLHLVSATGSLKVLGMPPRQARRHCAYVPQADSVDPDFPIGTLGVVLMGVGNRTGPPLWPRKRDKATARAALERVGLDGCEHRPFTVLSGGQRQRVLVARALAARPDVLLLDEPFSGVDATSARIIEESLREVRRQGGTVLVATHDHEFAHRACSHVLLLNGVQYGFGPCEEVLTSDAIADCYTGRAGESTASERSRAPTGSGPDHDSGTHSNTGIDAETESCPETGEGTETGAGPDSRAADSRAAPESHRPLESTVDSNAPKEARGEGDTADEGDSGTVLRTSTAADGS